MGVGVNVGVGVDVGVDVGNGVAVGVGVNVAVEVARAGVTGMLANGPQANEASARAEMAKVMD